MSDYSNSAEFRKASEDGGSEHRAYPRSSDGTAQSPACLITSVELSSTRLCAMDFLAACCGHFFAMRRRSWAA